MFFSLLNSFVSAAGAMVQGNAAASASRYNASIDQYNQTITQQQGVIAQQQMERQTAGVIGEDVARAGASGFSSTRGSAADVIASSSYNATIDALTTKYNYDVKANTYGAEAQLQRQKAGYDETAAYLTAGSDLLTGVSRANAASYASGNGGALPFRIGG